jgi:hypothetical protein
MKTIEHFIEFFEALSIYGFQCMPIEKSIVDRVRLYFHNEKKNLQAVYDITISDLNCCNYDFYLISLTTRLIHELKNANLKYL